MSVRPVGRLTGWVVRTTRGRDAGAWYLVVGQRGKRWLLADGARRRVRCPKPKNSRHLAPVKPGPWEPPDYQDGRIRTLLNAERRQRAAAEKGGSGHGQG